MSDIKSDSSGLPQSGRIDVSRFSTVFKETTNSYKYLFFLGLLDCLESSRFDETVFQLRDIGVAMIKRAWSTHVKFRLNFGVSDQIGNTIDEIVEARGSGEKPDPRLITELSDSKEILKLLRYVPTRLIRPFFREQTRGKKDQFVNNLIVKLSNEEFETTRPLYLVDYEWKTICLHHDWLLYLHENIGIVKSWALWNWLKYLQTRNPSVPNIAEKIFEPNRNRNLAEQRKYWLSVIDSPNRPFRCIYSGKVIDVNSYALDHFVPWAFVCHNQIWNLVPTLPAINSSKSDSVPSSNYVENLAKSQYHAAVINKEILGDKKWKKKMEPFIQDMGIKYSDLTEREKLVNVYKERIPPLIALAQSNGFAGNWMWN